MKKSFALGIDLGTSNSAASWADLSTRETPAIMDIPQTLGVSSLGARETFPSATYLPNESEFPDSLALPTWDSDEKRVIRGLFAREHGAMVPERLITSAKSWLSNPHVDARAAILPWQSEISETQKLSPFEATRGYLEHLRKAYESSENAIPLEEGEIVVTVPASFDEVARNLTADAAEAAGFENAVLLEEPLAAFYAWTAQTGSDWRNQVEKGDIVLVCDVGGGTADFSLLFITDLDGSLEIERISVGEHLLLGGDNMDLALAYTLQAKLAAEGTTIDAWQMLSLIQSCGAAKVTLFSRTDLDEAPISIPSRGSSLLAKTISTKLDRATLESVVLDGFFPMTKPDELPQEGKSGLHEFGLPYASDPVVSKHLARFLKRSLENVKASEELSQMVSDTTGDLLHPTAILFNGGAFKADAVRQRVLDLLGSWNQGEAPTELQGFQPDLAVARGAAVYARNRATGQGLRIKAGTSRSYYLGLESSMPAIPGFKPPLKGVCVVPQGMEEGSEHILEGQEFGLITGQEAEFRFLSSEVRSGDEPGTIVDNAEAELEETASLAVELPPLDGHELGEMIPVKLHACVTELGNLELWMQHTGSEKRWQLTFNVRTE
ncbi:MAG: Hsp70 family protein [Verrucomicrobiales bacterium]|nr:Hsp70 family protein [Verrucomicrobiales bacterium]